MNDDVCKLTHKQINDTLDIHNTRLKEHSKRIGELEKVMLEG
jgi:hypothetical protein